MKISPSADDYGGCVNSRPVQKKAQTLPRNFTTRVICSESYKNVYHTAMKILCKSAIFCSLPPVLGASFVMCYGMPTASEHPPKNRTDIGA